MSFDPMRSRRSWIFALLLLACAPAPARLAMPEKLVLSGNDARAHDVSDELAASRLTVFVFAGKSCACLDAHAARLRRLYDVFSARGVAFRMVDSEVGGSPARAAQFVQRGFYRFPALVDEHARLAKALGAEFVSHTVVVDSRGSILYSGGIDSDAARLHDDAEPYLEHALDDLLAGRPARVARSEALGCALELD